MYPFIWLKDLMECMIIRYILEWVILIRQSMGMQIIRMWKSYGEYIFKEKKNEKENRVFTDREDFFLADETTEKKIEC